MNLLGHPKSVLAVMSVITDYGHMETKSLILCGPNSNPNPIWNVDIKDKGLTVPNWVLKVWPKMPQKISAQAQMLGIFKRQLSLGVRSPCL